MRAMLMLLFLGGCERSKDPLVLVDGISPAALTSDGQLYWLQADGVHAVDKAGQEPRLIAASKGRESDHLLLDGAGVFFSRLNHLIHLDAAGKLTDLGQARYSIEDIAADGEYVYFSSAMWLGRAPRNGGPVDVLISSDTEVIDQLAADGNNLYFRSYATYGGTSDDNGLWMMPRDGGTARLLSSTGSFPVVMDGALYYEDRVEDQVVIMRRWLGAAGSKQLAVINGFGLQGHKGRLFWREGGPIEDDQSSDPTERIMSLPAEGGSPTPVLEENIAISAFTADDNHVYYSSYGSYAWSWGSPGIFATSPRWVTQGGSQIRRTP